MLAAWEAVKTVDIVVLAEEVVAEVPVQPLIAIGRAP